MKLLHGAGVCLLAALAGGAAGAPACPGGASWCEDFERGLDRWESAAPDMQVQAQSGTGNHLLRLRGDAPAFLVRAADTAVHTKQAHFVEARLRPAPGALGQGGQVYLIVRYQDARNWLGVGLNAARDGGRVQMVLSRMHEGRLETLKSGSAEVKGADSFATLRIDVDGDALTLYLNGNRIVGTSVTASAPERVGLLAIGGEFDVDDLRIGDASVAPARIGLANLGQQLELQAGDGPQRYPVRTISTVSGGLIGGGTAGTARAVAVSSDPRVLTAAVDGDALVLTPRQPGKATITVAQADDNNLAAAIDVLVGQPFAAGQARLARGRVQPEKRAADVPVDTLLQLRFDNPLTPGAGGSVRIYRAADDALVDVIRPGDDVDTIGASPDGWRRVVRRHAIEVDGQVMTIHPHDARLAYGTEYYVQVDASLASGARMDGRPFTGIGKTAGKAAGWTFRTRARAPGGASFTVDDDGPADFRTIQGALDHAMRTLPRAQPVTISIADGRYRELLYLRGKDNVLLRGQCRDGVRITAENNDSLNAGAGTGQPPLAPGASGGRAVFLIQDADLVQLDRLTIVNTAWNATPPGGQSETVNFASDGRFMALDSSFISEQDTIRVEGWSWFYRSLVAGTVDFIWGPNHAALFEESEIRSVGNSNGRVRGGYVVQARTLGRDDPGFVFLNSRLTHGAGGLGNDTPPASNYLARPGTAATWDKVSYINCRIDGHIAPAGWTGQPREGTGWFEYGSMDLAGQPLDLSSRSGGAVLPAAQAQRFSSRARVFAGFDHGRGWDPSPTGGHQQP
jgi:pectin methylesterase-like acyl-CoA thioesterase